MENLVYAIILLPLLGFLINGLFGKNLPKIVSDLDNLKKQVTNENSINNC